MRVLSGIQPSGSLHLGNYFGAIAQFLARQAAGDQLFVFVADWHALTSTRDAAKLRANVREIAAAYVALGLDPARTVLYRQSDVPEIPELAWLLACLAPMGLLERAHAFKDKTARGLAANVGLFTYPILMAADILVMQAERVPVGRDQKQHVEIARDLAEKFNAAYGEVLPLPEPEILETVAVVPGTDGQKMSKSYGNTVDLFADEAVLKKQVMGIVTDSTPRGQPLDPARCNVFQLFQLVATKEAVAQMHADYLAGAVGYGDAKKTLLAAILEKFGPARARFAELLARPEELEKILTAGAEQARAVAGATLSAVRRQVGLI